VAGDTVHFHGTYAENPTVAAGVALRGRGPNSIINGYVTVLGKLLHCLVYQSVNTADDVVNVIADTDAYLSHVDVLLLQAGAGKALGIYGCAGVGEAPANGYDCNIKVLNTGGGSEWEYAGTVEGAIVLHQGSVVGSWAEA
jgi:hypothetical protein